MPRWMWSLLPIGPIAFLLSFFHPSNVLLFALSALGIVPLAALIGKATQELADKVGDAAGGLLNATFGNVPELIIAGLAIHQGLLTLARASIIGSVIGNASLVVGMALFAGGLRHGIQTFSKERVGHHAVLMVLAVASLALPSLFRVTAPRGNVETLSVFVSLLLLTTYVAYLVYDIGGLHNLDQIRRRLRLQPVGSQLEAADAFISESQAVEELVERDGEKWPWQLSIALLAGAVALTLPVGNVLVDTVHPVTKTLGISQFFVGLVIVPIIGNVAEHIAAVQLAWRNRLDLSFAIASGSSIQVAVFVAPLLVLLSFFWHPMTLVFDPIQIVVLALVVAIFFFVAQDGESNWLEGLQLMMIYAMAATVFYFLPVPKV